MAHLSGAAESNEPWRLSDQPWLLPWNRRLRHLHRIVIRNITTGYETNLRVTIRSTDDEALPKSLSSPEKLLALDESFELTRTSSSTDLRGDDQVCLQDAPSEPSTTGEILNRRGSGKQKRPGVRSGNLRRRSTLDWARASSLQKQSRLHDLTMSRLVDVFFSLHVDGVHEPIYVSEEIRSTMNPSFGHIDWQACGPNVTRADNFDLRVWTRRADGADFALVSHSSVALRDLRFLGRVMTTGGPPLTPNRIVFELADGYYACQTETSRTTWNSSPIRLITPEPQTKALPSSSFDALLRLSKLDDSIQDAIALRDRIKADLDRTVESSHAELGEADRLKQTEDFLKTVDFAKARVQKQLQSMRRSRDMAKQSLDRKRELLATGRRQQAVSVSNGGTTVKGDMNGNIEKQLPMTIQALRIETARQRRRICEGIQRFYPVESMPDRSLSFTIRGLHLPNSEEMDAVSPEEVAGALGYVCHVVQLLSFFLEQPLPYPVFPRSSTSTISDPISILNEPNTRTTSSMPKSPFGSKLDTSRIFPLYARGVPRFRFEYGVFLLNKNIELLLSNVFRVRVLDIRQTLPNLLYVLYCATAGEGELPSRKAGGIRGLLKTGKTGRFGDEDASSENRAGGEGRDGDDDLTVQSFKYGSLGRRRMSKMLERDSSTT